MVTSIRITLIICFLSYISISLFPYEVTAGKWFSRPGSTVTVNATTPKSITCPYEGAELTIYSIGDYSFNFDQTTLTTPNISNGDPVITSGNFFTTGIRYKAGVIGRVLSKSGTAILRLFWSLNGD